MQNDTCLGKPYQNISFWNMNIFGKYLTQGHSFNTLVNQISFFDKVVYQTWSISFESLLNMCICVYNIPYAICVFVSATYSILYLKCLVLYHLGPHHQESEYDHLLVVQSSGVDIFVHDFLYNGQTNFTFDIKWNSFDVKLLFWKLIFKTYFLHVL